MTLNETVCMIKALIFDLNGVLVDDEPVHFRMFQRVLRGEGIALTKRGYYRLYLGMNDKDCFTTALKKQGIKPTPAKIRVLVLKKGRWYRAFIAKHLIFFPGACDFVRRAAGKYPLAIASGALRSEIRYILRKGHLAKYFSVIVAAEDVRNGKPHPDGFLRAMKMLNKRLALHLRPKECLVIEDSLEGIEAAKRAGMCCLALATSYPSSKLKAANLVAKNYRRIKLQNLETLDTV